MLYSDLKIYIFCSYILILINDSLERVNITKSKEDGSEESQQIKVGGNS